jgi:Protein of unknown function (DUF3572)
MTLSMSRAAAETLGLKALGWLANSPDDLGRFLSVSGAEADQLRAGASDPAFLGAVLDFLLGEDGMLCAFCEAQRVDHRQVHLARRALEGG